MHNVSDLVIRIKNATLANRKEVVIPFSNLSKKIAELLVKEGFLEKVTVETIEGRKAIKAIIKYEKRKPVFSDVKIVSKPSLRIYEPKKNIFKFKRGKHTVVLSTSKGVLTGEKARKEGVGGEILFEIW